MKFSEEKRLKRVYATLQKYAQNQPVAETFYENVDTIKIRSLQDLTFQSDLSFLLEVQSILNVIISIIAHPHLSNKGEDVILRADQVHGIHAETLLKTIQDARLWKQKGQEMLPKEVYYYQNTDNYRIYENVFLMKLLDSIELELTKYQSFYLTQIKNLEKEDTNIVPRLEVEQAFFLLDQLSKKLFKIKSTTFYKDVSQVQRKDFVLHPTNILLKDYLYNRCYRFYKKIYHYGNEVILKQNLLLYYAFLMIQEFKRNQYQLANKSKKQKIDFQNKLVFHFFNALFKIVLTINFQENNLQIQIVHKKINSVCSNHLLLMDEQEQYLHQKKSINRNDFINYDTLSAISLWNICQWNEKQEVLFKNPHSEKEMIQEYVQDRLRCMKGNHFIYRRHCPVCKSNDLAIEEKITCLTCHSSYVLYDQNLIWFIHIRR